MAKELRAGISFTGDQAQTVVVELHDRRVELRHIEERTKESMLEYWFLDDLLSLEKKTLGKISRVSVAMDNSEAFFHRFPIDSLLTQVEQNEHVRWELSHFIADYKPQEYINDVHILRTHARDHFLDILVAAVRRSFLFKLHEYLAEQNLNLQTVEANVFSVTHALLLAYPEVKTTAATMVGISNRRLDIGILSNGRLTDYSYRKISPVEEAIGFLKESLEEANMQNIFLHGPSLTAEWMNSFRAAFGAKMMDLNPFRHMMVASSCQNFKQFNGREHRFAACVGSALRN